MDGNEDCELEKVEDKSAAQQERKNRRHLRLYN